jgi:hypothetical protein
MFKIAKETKDESFVQKFAFPVEAAQSQSPSPEPVSSPEVKKELTLGKLL